MRNVHFPDDRKIVAFTEKQIDLLMRKGLVFTEADVLMSWNYYACVAVLRDNPDANRCDFCSGEPVVAYYPAKDIDVSVVDYGSASGWYACIECDVLIGMGEWEKMSLRAARLFIERNPVAVPKDKQELTAVMLASLHAAVREAMTGERIGV